LYANELWPRWTGRRYESLIIGRVAGWDRWDGTWTVSLTGVRHR
jgi:hypothetical protein